MTRSGEEGNSERMRKWLTNSRTIIPWAVFSVLVLLPLYAGTVLLAARTGLFRNDGQALTGDEVKALWGLVGAGIAGAIALAGTLITRSQAERTERRLKLDTTVASLELVSNQDRSAYAPPAVVAAALSTLVHLDQPVIALRALSSAWKDQAVDPAASTWIISRVLESADDSTRLEAALLLNQQVESLTVPESPGEFSWPLAVYGRWQPSLSTEVRYWILLALIRLMLSQPYSWWGEPGRSFFVVTFDEVLCRDDDRDARAIAARCLRILVEAEEHKYGEVTTPLGVKRYADISARIARSEADQGAGHVAEFNSLLPQIPDWVERKDRAPEVTAQTGPVV